MKYTLSLPVLTRVCLATLVALLLFACGGESSAPPAPSTPPPFQPQTVVVKLGDHGGATTLISTQSGGWTRDGQAFASGNTVTGENSASYRLTLSNGTWRAEFIPPDPEAVSLGTSGDRVQLQIQEDGSYQLDGEPFATGSVVDADNGNQYRLELGSDGTWSAVFVTAEQRVRLGTSGETRQVGRSEDGGYTVDGETLTSGMVVEATNGNQYRLELGRDGTWSAVFVAAEQRVQLGTSGETRQVARLESGRYTLDGRLLLSGDTVRVANGNQYRLELGSDGTWTAVFIAPASIRVPLGTSGESRQVGRSENGGYTLNGETLTSGMEVEASNGNRYRLELGSDRTWTAVFVPPPPLEVPLGRSGETRQVRRLENGLYTLDDQTLTSGAIVSATNGDRYRMILGTDRSWRAEFVTPSAQNVRLGNSTESRQVIRREGGGYTLDGELLTSGTVVTGENGKQYRFLLGSDGMTWTAVFVAPAQQVQLGESSETRQVVRLEGGGYTLDGKSLTSGTEITGGNGNRYRFLLGSDGTWTAEFVMPVQRVQLGESGDPPLLVYQRENRTYVLDDEQLVAGRVHTATTGQRYRLSLGQDAMWQAVYEPTSETVDLGTHGGRVRLTLNENGTWQYGSTVFRSGEPETVTGDNGFDYQLTYQDGEWTVEPLTRTIDIPVTNVDGSTISLVQSEDGEYSYNDNPVTPGQEVQIDVQVGGMDERRTYTLQRTSGNRWSAQFLEAKFFVALGSADGSIPLYRLANGTYEYDGQRGRERVRNFHIVRSPTTRRQYRLTESNGVWTSSLWVPPTTGPGDGDGGGGTDPVVAAENIIDALPSAFVNSEGLFQGESRAQDNVPDPTDSGGTKIDYSPYRGSGSYEDDTFVKNAIRAIDKILGPIAGFGDLDDSEERVSRILIDSNWEGVKTELAAIFGPDPDPSDPLIRASPPVRSGETDVDESVDILEDLKEELSDRDKFKREFSARIDTSDGDKIFDARKRVLALGSSNNTRFGVHATLDSPATAKDVADNSASYDSHVFAFSPLKATDPANLPSRGTAHYSGRTWAVDGNQVLYSGAIKLMASIGIEDVKGEISNLLRIDNNSRWVHNGNEVSKIELPQITEGEFHGTNGTFSRTGSGAFSRVKYDEFGGLFFADVTNSEHTGRFVGEASNNQAGVAVIGTWRVGAADANLLKGSYGAERDRTNPVTFPLSSSDVDHQYDPQSSVTFDTTNKTLEIDSFGSDADDLFQLSSLNNTTRSKIKGSNTATVRLRNTSFARFGVWKIVDSSNNNSTTDGVFGYSPLAKTSYSGAGDDLYPRRVSAVYTGRTVAIDNSGNLYDGSYQLKVDWTLDAVGGSLRAVISSLRTVSGSNQFTIGGIGVSQIGFEDTVGSSADFSGPDKTTVQYTTGSTVELKTGTRTHAGDFVGYTGVDGPFGVIGNWGIVQGNDTIKGAFGADLVRAP